MSSLSKFEKILDAHKKGEEIPEIVLAYKYKDSPFGELALGYIPLFTVDPEDFSWYLFKYSYLLNDEKARRVKEIKKELEYLDYELHEKSSEYDKLKKEFNNIEVEARNKKLKDNE